MLFTAMDWLRLVQNMDLWQTCLIGRMQVIMMYFNWHKDMTNAHLLSQRVNVAPNEPGETANNATISVSWLALTYPMQLTVNTCHKEPGRDWDHLAIGCSDSPNPILHNTSFSGILNSMSYIVWKMHYMQKKKTKVVLHPVGFRRMQASGVFQYPYFLEYTQP